jgi:hypothetical protein
LWRRPTGAARRSSWAPEQSRGRAFSSKAQPLRLPQARRTGRSCSCEHGAIPDSPARGDLNLPRTRGWGLTRQRDRRVSIARRRLVLATHERYAAPRLMRARVGLEVGRLLPGRFVCCPRHSSGTLLTQREEQSSAHECSEGPLSLVRSDKAPAALPGSTLVSRELSCLGRAPTCLARTQPRHGSRWTAGVMTSKALDSADRL